jgi:hypothetical protein
MRPIGRRKVVITLVGAGLLGVVVFASIRLLASPADDAGCPAGQTHASLGVTVAGDAPGYATKEEAVRDALGTLDHSPYGGTFGALSENDDGTFAVDETSDLISDVEVQIEQLEGGRYVPGGVTFCATQIATDDEANVPEE